MESALSRLLDERVRIRAAGRTDAGVHAREQVVDFTDSGRRSLEAIVRGGNALLPPDIRILSAEEVPLDFDSRRWARAKEYRYFIRTGPIDSPFFGRFAWHFDEPLDAAAMQRALEYLVGEHDFSAFRGQGCTAKTPVRTILSAAVVEPPEWPPAGGVLGDAQGEGPAAGCGPAGAEEGGRWDTGAQASRLGSLSLQKPRLLAVCLAGTGFLRHMVRNIAGTVAQVGRGKYPPQRVREILASRKRSLAGPTAPARGLFIWKVHY